jgi:excisionase family DNA binding protein
MSIMKLMVTGPLRPELVFCSVATAAEYLGVHEKYVFQLINEGKVQRIRVVDRKGRDLAVGVVEDSLKAYRKRQPGRTQLDLLPESG